MDAARATKAWTMLWPGVPWVKVRKEIPILDIQSARLNADEASAIGSMRTYNTALLIYQSTYPEAGFPRSSYMDETCIIRYTEEDRAATRADNPLQ
jgi:hypothetical protein